MTPGRNAIIAMSTLESAADASSPPNPSSTAAVSWEEQPDRGYQDEQKHGPHDDLGLVLAQNGADHRSGFTLHRPSRLLIPESPDSAPRSAEEEEAVRHNREHDLTRVTVVRVRSKCVRMAASRSS